MDIGALFQNYQGKLKTLIILGPPVSKIESICHSLSCLGGFFYSSFKEVFKLLDSNTALGELCQKYNSQGFPLQDELAVTLWERYIKGLINAYLYHPQKQVLILEGLPLNSHQAKLLDKTLEVVGVISLTMKSLRSPVLDCYPQSLVGSINADQEDLDVLKDVLLFIRNKI